MSEPVRIGDATLYLGDCLEILPTLGQVDAVVTDPPYGIGFKYESYDDTEENWYQLINSCLPILREKARIVIMPHCRMEAMSWWFEYHRPDWIIAWYKGSPGHRASIGFNDWEPHLVWGKPPKPMHDYFQTALVIDNNGHPCVKPVAYAKWLCERAALAGQTILDPFMGSGTTGIACARLGRKFIGIEIEPKYFDIACKRIAREYEQLKLFPPEEKHEAVQLEMDV